MPNIIGSVSNIEQEGYGYFKPMLGWQGTNLLGELILFIRGRGIIP